MDVDVISKKIKKIVGILLVIFLIVAIIASAFIVINLMPYNSKDENTYSFEVESGMSKNSVINKLDEKKLIKNAFVFKIYVKMINPTDFLAGTYLLSPSMDASTIVEYLTTGKSIQNETVSITFVEGKRFPYYVSKIAENFDYSEDDIYSAINETYLKSLIDKYWFIDEAILNENLYYPLEGYLFPDTYEFKKSATIEEILDKMIGTLGTKLADYKDEINLSKYSVHSLLTIASVVELEAVSADDRGNVAGVLYNRLDKGMQLGCDVTTYYGAKVEVGDNNIDFNACNQYNTRGTCVSALPVGPIASPSLTSIISAINPTKNNYLYFVADKNTKVYFSEDYAGFQKTINELKSKGLWL